METVITCHGSRLIIIHSGAEPHPANDPADICPVRQARKRIRATTPKKAGGDRIIQTPRAVATPFPPLKRKNTGKIWPRNEARPTHCGLPGHKKNHPQQSGYGPFGHIEHKRGDPGRLAGHSHYVGGTYIAGAALAGVAQPLEAHDQNAERQRPQQISAKNQDPKNKIHAKLTS